MPLIALGELRRDELGGRARDHFLAETTHGRVEQPIVGPHPSRLKERGADRHILLCKGDQLLCRADRVTDLQLQVP